MGKIQNVLQTRKGKVILGGLIGAVLVGGAVTVKVQSDSAAQEKARVLVQTEVKENEKLLTKAEALFDTTQAYLKKDIKQSEISDVKSDLEKNVQDVKAADGKKFSIDFSAFENSKTKVEKTIEKAEKMFSLQEKVNQLFTEPAMNSFKISENPVLNKDTKLESIQGLEKELQKEEENTPFQVKIPFKTRMLNLTKTARTQYDDINNAEKAVEEVLKAKEDEKKLESAQSSIDKIKNEDIKKELLEKIKPAKLAIESKKAKESEEAASAAQAQVQTQKISGDTNGDGVVDIWDKGVSVDEGTTTPSTSSPTQPATPTTPVTPTQPTQPSTPPVENKPEQPKPSQPNNSTQQNNTPPILDGVGDTNGDGVVDIWDVGVQAE